MKIYSTLPGRVAIAAFVALTTLVFAACGGGGGGGTTAGVGCQSYGGGGTGSGAGSGSCSGTPLSSPTPAASAQPVGILLSGENAQNVAPYGAVLGYFNGMNPNAPNGSNVVNLTAGENVRFFNFETTSSGVPHTASSLGTYSGSFPAGGPGISAQSASAAGSSIGSAGFSSGVLNPGQSSAVYTTGGSGNVYVFGCFFHYASNKMRTIVIVM